MRASTLTFIFIISEYSIITGGDGNCGNPPDINNTEKAKNTPNTKFRMMCKPGYMRKVGTSNLFKCEKNMWVNNPPLKCIEPPYKSTQNSTPHSTFTPSWSSNNGTQAMNSTPTVSGKTVSTTIHTASTTSWTSHRTTQRTTTTTEETSVSTSITARIAASSTTEKDSLSVSMSSHSPSSRSTTSTGVSVVPDQQTGETTKGITAGIGIIITVVVFAAIVGFLLWRRRSTPPETSDRFVEKTRHNPGSDTPLMRVQTITSCSPDSTEPPASPLIDSTEIKYTNISISA